MQEFAFKRPLFGKEVLIVIYDMDEALAQGLCEKAYDEGLRLSKIFNIYDKKSVLSSLNRSRKLRVSKELLEVLKIAEEFYDLTDGLYDVSLGKIIQQRKGGMKEEAGCTFKDIQIEGNMITLNNPDVIIDLGSVAKGYIVDRMAKVLHDQGVLSGFIDGRGDIRIWGEHKQAIGIQHPRKAAIIKNINVTDCGIATSGDYNQHYGDYEKSHIIHSKDFSSITVVGEDLAVADAFATAFFVCPSAKLLERFKSLKIMTIDKDMNICYYNGFEGLL